MVGVVRGGKFILTLLLIAAWLPAMAHCQFEVLGVISVDECCEQDAHGNSHSDDACQSVEDGSFKTECAATVPAPVESAVILVDLCALACPSASDGLDVTDGEFQARCLAQFVIATAQPIRGPSFAS